MSTHPRVTVEGLDPFMWIAARWMGIDMDTARHVAERISEGEVEGYGNGERDEDREMGIARS